MRIKICRYHHHVPTEAELRERSVALEVKENRAKSLLDNIRKMLFSPAASDVQLIVLNERIYAHKFILCAKSDVFAAMFRHGTLESLTNEIVITDFSVATVKDMVEFMYTDSFRIDLTVEDSKQLLVIADKYQVGGLYAILT